MNEEIFRNSSSKWSVPAHITGFFQVVNNENSLKKGSLGAGFSFNQYISTQIFKESSKGSSVHVNFNGDQINGEVSKYIASIFSSFCEGKSIKINHESNLPISGGFGTSGAGALGAAFAMDDIFSTKMKNIKIAQIAHKAEVKNNTGLGDVISQYYGGSEIRIKAGAPGIGEIMHFDWSKNIKVMIVYLGTMSTKSVLTNNIKIAKINKISIPLIESLLKNPSVEKFVEYSYEFAKNIKIMSKDVYNILKELNKNFLASMVMIGESIFVLGTESELNSSKSYINDHYPDAKIWISELADNDPIKMED